MFPVTINEAELDWQAGPYSGVQLKVLNRDEATGGVTVLRKFEKGTIVPAHIHPQANETAYILEGQWEESGTTYSPWHPILRPARRTPWTAYRPNRRDQPDNL